MEDATVAPITVPHLKLSLYAFDLLPSNICHPVQAMLKSKWLYNFSESSVCMCFKATRVLQVKLFFNPKFSEQLLKKKK